MPVRDEVLEANRDYAESFSKGDLPTPPARRFAVVTCMDARLDPAKFLGLDEGDAHVIRNAGGVVSDDALRSLVISHWLLGTQEALVIAHTGCGMLTFTNEDIHAIRGPGFERPRQRRAGAELGAPAGQLHRDGLRLRLLERRAEGSRVATSRRRTGRRRHPS
jgi:carbonic anhydrase